jgi:hypothetical protein
MPECSLAFDPKRTWLVALHMSASDPKRTLRVDSIVVAAGRQRGVLSPNSSITPINALGPTFTVPENG